MWKSTTLYIAVICFSLVSGVAAAEPVWIDVRSLPEHLVDHIDGDLRVAHSDIVEEVSRLYPNKDTEIRLYCRSGGRAEKAMSALQAAGYTKVSNEGGISDARKMRELDE